jgi:hypothetical protein
MTSSPDFAQRLRVCRWGAILALFTVLVGFALGGVFGAFEDSLKADLSALAETGRDSVYGGDAAKMKSVVEKSWAYYKRAHLHGGGIGAAALSVILLLASLRRPTVVLRRGLALALGLGGLGYTTFWLLAARRAPGLGSTHAAKESLSWLAVPSAGLLLLGLTTVLVLTAIELFAPEPQTR